MRHPCVGNLQGKSRGRIGDRFGLNFFECAPLCTVRAGQGLVGDTSREFSAIFGRCRLPRPTPDFRRLCDQSESAKMKRMDGKCIQGTFVFCLLGYLRFGARPDSSRKISSHFPISVPRAMMVSRSPFFRLPQQDATIE